MTYGGEAYPLILPKRIESRSEEVPSSAKNSVKYLQKGIPNTFEPTLSWLEDFKAVRRKVPERCITADTSVMPGRYAHSKMQWSSAPAFRRPRARTHHHLLFS